MVGMLRFRLLTHCVRLAGSTVDRCADSGKRKWDAAPMGYCSQQGALAAFREVITPAKVEAQRFAGNQTSESAATTGII